MKVDEEEEYKGPVRNGAKNKSLNPEESKESASSLLDKQFE